MPHRNDFYSASRLKLGIFGANLASGLAATRVPERWSGTWDDNLALAQVLDAAGIEFMLPVGRWKGYGGATNFEGAGFETVSWACGLLAATKRLTAFGTVHAPLVHPVFAAKQFVTVDHVSHGRFGLNVVCGWNQDEFDMFGVDVREHEARYAYGAEWLNAILSMWSNQTKFDITGEYIKLRAVEAEPKPFGGTRPVVMNAGSSATGRAFAIANCDFLFTIIKMSLDDAARSVAGLVAEAATLGKPDFGVFATANVVCRPTTREAEEYYRYYADEQADWDAVDNMVGIGSRVSATSIQSDNYKAMRVRFAAGYGGWPLVGDPDAVAAGLERLSDAGFRGVALGFVNYLAEFPYFRDEVIPRLERSGVRVPLSSHQEVAL
jgi:dimethylsulfone monooxygenase